MERQVYQKTEAFMARCMADSVHDTLHVYRVLYYALRLARGRQDIDGDVVVFSALLHDIGRADEAADPAVCHAEAGGAKALEFLLALPVPAQTAHHVAACIRTHRHKAGQTPATGEAKLLYDADKLDLTGAVGAARAILFGGQIDEPLYRLGPGGLPTEGAREEGPSLLREYNRKLKDMEGLFYTEEAKRIAREQQPAMDGFFAGLNTEINRNHKEGLRLLQDFLVD